MIEVVAECRNGKAERITVTNVPSFADKLDATLEVAGLGTLQVDTAYGGDSFVIVERREARLRARRQTRRAQLAETGMRITAAANEQLGFSHPGNTGWDHISFCAFAGPVYTEDGVPMTRSAVAIRPGKIDRSPTGTAVSARMAVLHARGEMQVGESLTARLDHRFALRRQDRRRDGRSPGTGPSSRRSRARAWITGTHQHMLDPDDPWPGGYRLTDTWPAMG